MTNSTVNSSYRIVVPLAAILAVPAHSKETVYNLTIAEQQVNITGGQVTAMTVNGGIPGPVLRFTEGDTAVIHVRNTLSESASIHWHGILLPPGMDGVPFISFPPIEAGSAFTYRFTIRQNGTYWYHSHSGLQEQKGVYGAIVITPKELGHHADRDHVVVLGDWTNSSPSEVLRTLRRGSEFFGIRKQTAQSVLGATKTGKLSEYFGREAMRMPAMDLADVAYDAFITNGRPEQHLAAGPGETIRLRVVNAAASTFFHLHYSGGAMTVISADGQAVQPFRMHQPLLIGVAETYDVLVKVPARNAYEFRATAHDGSGHTSLWIGHGNRHPGVPLPKPFVYDTMMGFDLEKAFALTPAGVMGMPDREVDAGKFDEPGMHMGMHEMPHRGQMSRMDHDSGAMEEMNHEDGKGVNINDAGHGHKGMMDTPGPTLSSKPNPPTWYDFLLREDAAHAAMLATDGMSPKRPFPPYNKLRATKSTAFPSEAPRRAFRLTLDGDMGRYVWMLNNRPLAPEDDLHIREGEVVRFILINRTMMHHPMHLHGHFFRVVNGQDDRAPLKHTVNVAPMSTTVIEFMADEPGDWFFHCHLLYHMMSGMARVVRYEHFTPDPATQAVQEALYIEHDPLFFYGHADILSNMTQGDLTLSTLMTTFSLEWEAGWEGVPGTPWEANLTYGRFINRFTTVFGGVYAEGVNGNQEEERLVGGIHYVLPGNFASTAWIDSDGGARIALERELRITPRLAIFGEAEYDTREKWSYQAGAEYILTQYISATALWDSDFGTGVGMTIRF